MNELVSIITPNYNCEKFIFQTIESVQSQTYSNWELIIVDDASTDTSIKIIERFIKNDARIQLIKLNQNAGSAVCRNKGIEKAKGNYIAFLDSDDSWLSNKLKSQVEFMLKNDCELSFSSYYLNNLEGELVKAKSSVSYNNLLFNNYIGCLTAMYSVKKLGKVYFPLIRKRQDWALWLEITRLNVTAKGIQEPLAIYNDRISSISHNKFNLLKYNWSVYRKFEKFNCIKATFYLVVLVVNKFLK